VSYESANTIDKNSPNKMRDVIRFEHRIRSPGLLIFTALLNGILVTFGLNHIYNTSPRNSLSPSFINEAIMIEPIQGDDGNLLNNRPYKKHG
jgi:hypothetical protein